jgi:hypothetical protein
MRAFRSLQEIGRVVKKFGKEETVAVFEPNVGVLNFKPLLFSVKGKIL